jgi:hypothetical protein
MDKAITNPGTRLAKEIQQTIDNIHGRNTIHESVALYLVFHPQVYCNGRSFYRKCVSTTWPAANQDLCIQVDA